MKKLFAKRARLVLLALLVLTLVACGGGQADTVGITYVQAPLNVPAIVARELGIFEQAFEEFGMEVHHANLTTGPDQIAALASGDIQFLFAVGGTSVIQAAAGGLDIRIISVFSRAPQAFMLFSNDDSIASAADLQGRTVAGPMGTILHQLLAAYLQTAGLTTGDVNFVSMDIADGQAALLAGAVDLALMAGPAAYITAQGGTRLVTDGEGLIEGTIVVAVLESFYRANRPLVEAFLQAQNRVLDFIADNPGQSMEITASATGLPIEAVQGMFPMYDFRSEILPSDIQSLEDTMRFMLENAMIDREIDIRGLVLGL
ncbi:MAG: NrtA/SsuA/CpmA family ABC transporter substrate-binding protein [Spirochaetes bacterium]|nr:NrtA/SsuA/CpmA family ABC transporter substrate-binding protein [Spirochaetota bacterium]